MRCLLHAVQEVPCKGELVRSEGLCVRHTVLFNYWLCDREGFRVYAFENPDSNQSALRRWKRNKFKSWLRTLSIAQVEAIMRS